LLRQKPIQSQQLGERICFNLVGTNGQPHTIHTMGEGLVWVMAQQHHIFSPFPFFFYLFFPIFPKLFFK
jgi:hypothetical protein